MMDDCLIILFLFLTEFNQNRLNYATTYITVTLNVRAVFSEDEAMAFCILSKTRFDRAPKKVLE